MAMSIKWVVSTGKEFFRRSRAQLSCPVPTDTLLFMVAPVLFSKRGLLNIT
jgi:hypothetical protein